MMRFQSKGWEANYGKKLKAKNVNLDLRWNCSQFWSIKPIISNFLPSICLLAHTTMLIHAYETLGAIVEASNCDNDRVLRMCTNMISLSARYASG